MSKGGYDKLLRKLQEREVELSEHKRRVLTFEEKNLVPIPSETVSVSREGKFHNFLHSTPVWGAFGVLAGVIVTAVASHSRAANFVSAGTFLFFWAVLCYEFIRLKIAGHRTLRLVINSAYCLVSFVAVFACWRLMPKVTDQPDPISELRKAAPWLFQRPDSPQASPGGAQPPYSFERKAPLRQRTLDFANDLFDWSVEQEGTINSWKQQAIAQSFIDSMRHNQKGATQFQNRLSVSVRDASRKFFSYYWPQIGSLQDELRAAGVDTTPISRAEASNDPPRAIALAFSVVASRIGKRGPFQREITPLEMRLLNQQVDIENIQIYAYMSDANSKEVAETLRAGFSRQKGLSVNAQLYPLEASAQMRHGIWLVYPSADFTTELNGFIPAFDECQLEKKWEIRSMKQPPSILKIEVWPSTQNWEPLEGPNLIQKD